MGCCLYFIIISIFEKKVNEALKDYSTKNTADVSINGLSHYNSDNCVKGLIDSNRSSTATIVSMMNFNL